MTALAAPALVAAALLVLAGAQKLIDPTMATGAMRALRLPASDAMVRIGSAAEMVIGALAVCLGGPFWWTLVGLSYLLFTLFVVAALRAGTMIGSCGCFGREETPPHSVHVVMDVLLTGVAFARAATEDVPLLDELTGHVGDAVVVVALAGLATYLVYVAFVHLPRTLRTATR